MFEWILYSLIIFPIRLLWRFLWLLWRFFRFCRLIFLIFKDRLISGDKIKWVSRVLFWGSVILITLISCTYDILLFQSDNLLSLLSIFFGVYVGFLQLMANKENGTYLGYQKMDFLTKSSVSYHLTNIWEFYLSLLLIISLPFIAEYNQFITYLGQGITVFLLILSIFLLKFISKVPILINKKSDKGLEGVIKSYIEKKYAIYFDYLVNQKFSDNARDIYFNQIKQDLSNIENVKDTIIFLEVIYFNVSYGNIVEKIKEFREADIMNCKYFIKAKYELIKERYELISEIDSDKGDELISFAISLFKKDTEIFDELIKRKQFWVESDDNFRALNDSNKQSILDVEINKKLGKPLYNSGEDSKIENIHIYIFEIIVLMAKNKHTISKLVNFIRHSSIPNNITNIYWKEDIFDIKKSISKEYILDILGIKKSISKEDILDIFDIEKSISTSNLKISKNNLEKKIKKIDVFLFSECSEISFEEHEDDVILLLNSDIFKIDFVFEGGKNYSIKRNVIRDYYDKYEEKVWNILLKKYIESDNISNEYLPDLKEPKIVKPCLGDKSEDIVQDYDNKITYSKICFKYLINSYSYIDSKTPKFVNVVKMVKTMSSIYRGAFALYQLLHPKNVDWDSSVETYIEILREVFFINENERENIYEDMILIINTIEYKYHDDIEYKYHYIKYLENVFAERDTENIDDDFLKKFKTIPILKVIIVQSILQKNSSSIRNIELQNSETKCLIKQYIKARSITPNIFLGCIGHDDDLNTIMEDFLLRNKNLLSSYEFSKLSLSSLLLVEEVLYWGGRLGNTNYKTDGAKFMITHIREKVDKESDRYNYHIYGSFVKFFTLKLIGSQREEYLKVINDKYFKDNFTFSLLDYLKQKKLTPDTYLDEIEKELESYDNLMIGIYEKELIKREVEKIVFENYSNVK